MGPTSTSRGERATLSRWTDAPAQSHPQLRLGLRVAVHHHSLRRKACTQGQVQLAARGHIAPQALLGEHREYGRAGERLRAEHHLHLLVTGLGPLQRIFDTVSLTRSQWGICLLGPLAFLGFAELGKLIDRRRGA